VLFTCNELAKFEELFRPRPYGMPGGPAVGTVGFGSGGNAGLGLASSERAYPERIYLIEQDWWRRWTDLSKFVIYRQMLKDQDKATTAGDWA